MKVARAAVAAFYIARRDGRATNRKPIACRNYLARQADAISPTHHLQLVLGLRKVLKKRELIILLVLDYLFQTHRELLQTLERVRQGLVQLKVKRTQRSKATLTRYPNPSKYIPHTWNTISFAWQKFRKSFSRIHISHLIIRFTNHTSA